MSLMPQKSPFNSIYFTHFHSSTAHITHLKNPNPPFLAPMNFPLYPSNLGAILSSRQYPLLKISNSWRRNHGYLRVYRSDDGLEDNDGSRGFDFEVFLSIVEWGLLVSSAVITVGCMTHCVINWVVTRQPNAVLLMAAKTVLLCLLAGAVAVGREIRRRQWRRIGGLEVKSGTESGNVVERIEILEENLKSAIKVIRMLSRQLEKLGIRFRVTKNPMKEPIDETAALCQKNSEATRALALQADILEKEISEIQKFLLAMQDQQQKQLELILAIAKASKLYEANRESVAQPSVKATDGRPKQAVDPERIQTVSGNRAPSNP